MILATAFAGSCATVGKVKKRDFKFLAPGEMSGAGVGELFFSYTTEEGPADNKVKKIFQISVLRLSDREMILKSVVFDEKEEKGQWKPLPGVKTFTFPMVMEEITLNDFSFQMLSFKDGRIRYRRIK